MEKTIKGRPVLGPPSEGGAKKCNREDTFSS